MSYTADLPSLNCLHVIILFSLSYLLCCEWMSACLQAVVIHLLFVSFYTTSQGHSVDLQLLYLFCYYRPLQNIWFIQHFFFYINFFLKIFVYFIMLKISMSDVTFIWEIKDMASIQWMALTYAFVVIDKVELWYINVYIHHTYYWTGGHTGLQSSINSRTDIFQAFEKQMLLYWNSIQSGWLNFLSLKQQLCCWILFCIYMYV